MALSSFLYVRPDEMWSLFGTVVPTLGAVDSDYQAAWFVDGRAGRPVRGTGNALGLQVTNTAREVGVIAVCNHNIDHGVTIAVTGGFTTSMGAPPLPANGIALNPYVQVTPASITTLTVTVTGNSQAVTIGELVAGKARTLDPAPMTGSSDFEIEDFGIDPQSEFSSMNSYDRGLEQRTRTGSQYYSPAQFADILEWWRSSRGDSVGPSLIIPDSSVQDAWLAKFTGFKWHRFAADRYLVSFTWLEYPRTRWGG